jgi:hypothetical protein
VKPRIGCKKSFYGPVEIGGRGDAVRFRHGSENGSSRL